MTPAAELVRLEGISKSFPGVLANDNVSLDLRAGEIHTILGENGAGKTTIMGVLCGLYRPDAGRIVVHGKPCTMHSPRDALQAGIGYVQQHFSLIPTLTIAQNLVLALQSSRQATTIKRAAELVRELSLRYGLEAPPDVPVGNLGVGQQQRAELIKALARDPQILVLDEPSVLLTPQESAHLAQVLRQLAHDGMGIFLISHKLEEVIRMSDRISVLRRGHHVGTLATAETSREQLAQLMVGELRPAEVHLAEASAPGRPLLEVTKLWVDRDRGGWAVQDVSFVVGRGEVLGIAGLEGSGQVELAEALAGARRRVRGGIRLDGRDITALDVRARQHAGLAQISADRQGTGLVLGLSVAENLVLPIADDKPYSRFGVLRQSQIRGRARELISRFTIRVPGPDVAVGVLSGGNQQKVVLARELSRDPRVVVCCYPTRGLDFAATEAVQQEILACRNRGGAVLWASVDLDELLGFTDRIIVMHQGRIAGEMRTVDASAEHIGLLMGGVAAA